MGQVVFSTSGTYTFSPSVYGLSAGDQITVSIVGCGGSGFGASLQSSRVYSGSGGGGGSFAQGTYTITANDVTNGIVLVVAAATATVSSTFQGFGGSASEIIVPYGTSATNSTPGSGGSTPIIGANFTAVFSAIGGGGGGSLIAGKGGGGGGSGGPSGNGSTGQSGSLGGNGGSGYANGGQGGQTNASNGMPGSSPGAGGGGGYGTLGTAGGLGSNAQITISWTSSTPSLIPITPPLNAAFRVTDHYRGDKGWDTNPSPVNPSS